MAFLLDTHALLWWWLNDDALSSRASEAISQSEDAVFVTAVSAIEIAIKVRIGKLPIMEEPLQRFDALVRRDGLSHLPVSHLHARQAGLMPGDHRDPFDRMIAAQALVEDLTVITRDPQIAAFGCKVLW